MNAPATLGELLRERAARTPARLAFAFVEDGDEESRLDYAALEQRARSLAGVILARGGPGARVLLVLPPSLDFVCALFACALAGAVGVPLAPPSRPGDRDRLAAIARDAAPAMVIAPAAIAGAVPELACLAYAGPHDVGDAGELPAVAPDDLALLQYTSGSTAHPRGVMLSHRNLLAGSAAIREAFGHDDASRGVIWLPPHHDMGLVGGILQPVFAGFPAWLMSPLRFLHRPMRWLELISRVRATTSGGPDFAYRLATRRAQPAAIAALDLSSWDVAFCGAEPVHAETLARFAEAFAPAGFSPRACYPCYGLAEATLLVAGGEKGRGVRSRVIGATTRVSLGAVIPGHALRIVDPQYARALPEGEVGEVWLSGPSIARGYFGRTDETEQIFGAQLEGEPGSWLRTGDEGVLVAGELHVVGRLKDVLVSAGTKHHAEDVEHTVEACHPLVRPGGTVAFGLFGEEGEVVVLAIECERTTDEAALGALCETVTAALHRMHGLGVGHILLLRAGALPRTTTGKKQRRLTRERFEAGTLAIVARWRLGTLASV